MIRPVSEVRVKLKDASDEKTRISGERFFREDVKIYGVKSAKVTEISKQVFKEIPEKDKKYIFGLCEELWKSGMMEESFIACNWSYYIHKQYEPSDFEIFEKWTNNYINNWASCDTFCNHTVGTFIEMYPVFISGLKKWAKSENRWMKRASAVSLIVPADRKSVV